MVSILLKDKDGIGVPYQEGEEPWESEGELVVLIPIEERRQVKGVTPNYRLYHDPEVVLYADPIHVAPVEDREAEYLQAVYPASIRLSEYLREQEKKMKMNLIVDDAVIFELKVQPEAAAAGSSVKGIIRYIGPCPNKEGIFFGIEINPQVSCHVVWVYRLFSMLTLFSSFCTLSAGAMLIRASLLHQEVKTDARSHIAFSLFHYGIDDYYCDIYGEVLA